MNHFLKFLPKFLGGGLTSQESRSANFQHIPDWEYYSKYYNIIGQDAMASVSVGSGMGLTDVYTCIKVLANHIGWLPKHLKQKTDKGTRIVDQSPLNELISRQPNSYQTAFKFWQTIGVHLWGFGNSYAYIHNRLDPSRTYLEILHPDTVNPKMIEGELFYRYQDVEIPSREMLHFFDLSTNGYSGISPITANKSLIEGALRQQFFAKNSVGTKPNYGILTSDVPLDDQSKKGAGQAFKDKIDSNQIPVLDRLKWVPGTLSPSDAQLIDQANMTTDKIYKMYGVPQLDGNYATAEQKMIVFVRDTLQPPITNIEQELDKKLLRGRNSKSFFKFNTYGLLKGDISTQKEWFQAMVTLGIYSPQRVLELLDEEWSEEDKTKYMQGAMETVKNIQERQAGEPSEPEPGPGNSDLDEPGTMNRGIMEHFRNLDELITNGKRN